LRVESIESVMGFHFSELMDCHLILLRVSMLLEMGLVMELLWVLKIENVMVWLMKAMMAQPMLYKKDSESAFV